MCRISGCFNPVYVESRGLCSAHYSRWRTTGTTDPGPRARGSAEVRFWKYVDKRGPDECWGWVAKSRTAGYGVLGLGGRSGGKTLAHRFSWELHNGPIPEGDGWHGAVVMHTCDNRLCVNPRHLVVGTQKQNVQDMDRKARRRAGVRWGEDHPNSKLSSEAVEFIRESKLPQRELAKMFGVSKYPIYRIQKGVGWRHV